ncbi:hypothetical protein J7K93_03845, partial [bacterium]|nr:hypothetical protein [bacterium]
FQKPEKKLFNKRFHFLKDSLLTVAEKTIKDYHRKIFKTEIMGALQTAERVFMSYDQHRKVLVIMSDMLEDSKLYRFTKENLTDTRITSIISAEEENKRIPDLKGVKVYVTGAIAGNSQKYFQVRNFWYKYMEKCGAVLSHENYGSNLIRFDE